MCVRVCVCVCVCVYVRVYEVIQMIAFFTGVHCITNLHVHQDPHQDLQFHDDNTPSRSVNNHLCPSAIELIPKVLSLKRYFNIAMLASTLGSLLGGIWSRGGLGRRVLREPAFWLAGLQRRSATTVVRVTVVGAVWRVGEWEVADRRCCRLKAGLLVLRVVHCSQATADERGDIGYLVRDVLFLFFYLLMGGWW